MSFDRSIAVASIYVELCLSLQFVLNSDSKTYTFDMDWQQLKYKPNNLHIDLTYVFYLLHVIVYIHVLLIKMSELFLYQESYLRSVAR